MVTMTEDQLLDTINGILQAAHKQCQPYYLQLAELWLPGVPVLRTESYISSKPTGTHALIDMTSVGLMEA